MAQRPDTQRRTHDTNFRPRTSDSLCPGCRRSRVETSLLQLVTADLPSRVCHVAGSHLAVWHTFWGRGADEHSDPVSCRLDAARRVPRGVPRAHRIRSRRSGRRVEGTTKTGRVRRVSLDPGTVGVLREHAERQAKER